MRDYNEREVEAMIQVIIKWRKDGKVKLAEALRERLEKRSDLSYEEIDALIGAVSK